MCKVFDIRGRYGTFGKIDTIDVKRTKVVSGEDIYLFFFTTPGIFFSLDEEPSVRSMLLLSRNLVKVS
jgi:hypothetical protein